MNIFVRMFRKDRNMKITTLSRLLESYKNDHLSLEELLEKLKTLPFEDLGAACVDHHRNLRTGFPEVIFGEGKKFEHLVSIIERFSAVYNEFIATRISPEIAEKLLARFPSLTYAKDARIIAKPWKPPLSPKVAVICAGTADYPVAEEACVTLDILGSGAMRVYDVGVSGIHRIVPWLKKLHQSHFLIVVAGMEGALPGVMAGMTGKPVVGVPTSVGYGASFHGLSALLTMLNSCAPNVVVVNIDNGFGAGFYCHLAIQQSQLSGVSTRKKQTKPVSSS